MATLNSMEKNMITFPAEVTLFLSEYHEGKEYYRIHLRDRNQNHLEAYAWEDEYQGPTMKQMSEVVVQGIKRNNHNQIRIQVLSITEVNLIPSQHIIGDVTLLQMMNSEQKKWFEQLVSVHPFIPSN